MTVPVAIEPPQSIELEQSLIGALLINNDANNYVAGLVSAEEFAEPIHGSIFHEIQRQLAAGQRVTPATLKAAFPDVEIVKGMTLSQYLARLAAEATSVINAPDYARQLRSLATLRSIMAVGRDCADAREAAKAPDVAVREAFERLDDIRLIATRSEGRASSSTMGEMMASVVEHFSAAWQNEGMPIGVVTGIYGIDHALGGMKGGDLIIVAGRPGSGKSSLAGSMSRGASQLGYGVGFFSLEMPKVHIGARMLTDLMFDSATKWEGPISYNRLLHAQVTPREADMIMAATRQFESLPMIIDDSSHLTVGEIAAKARGMAAKLKRAGSEMRLLVVDYLKFVKASDRYRGQRVYEVGEITSALKQLARDMGIPVMLLVQLNREVEKSATKRPELQHLRECVTGDTRVIDARTGHWRPITSILHGEKIMGLNTETQNIEPFVVNGVWSTGLKPVYLLQTKTGRRIKATGNHPFYTATGWKQLQELRAGDVIATAMRLPKHGHQEGQWATDLCRLLGYMVGDGSYQKHRTVSFISSDSESFDDVISIVARHFPTVRPSLKTSAKQKSSKKPWREADLVCTYENGYGKPGGNPLREWLRSIGIYGQRDRSKRIPSFVFDTEETCSNFLAGYLSSDGCVKVNKKGTRDLVWEVHFDTVSRLLAEDVQAVLLRIGVISSVNDGYVSKMATRPIYRVNVSPAAHNLKRLAQKLPFIGRKGTMLAEMMGSLAENITAPGIFSLPGEVSFILSDLAPFHAYNYGTVKTGWKHQGKRMRREVCASWARKLKNKILWMWALSDILWEEIVRIEPAGTEEVFDISVPGCANFIGNGIVAHNSGDVEADADVVILLYREAYYLQNDPETANDTVKQAKLAECIDQLDIIIAKNRMGPTGLVKVKCNIGCGAVRSEKPEQAPPVGEDDMLPI